MKKTCLITNDVETTSILHNALRDSTGLKVLNEGMPLLLDLYAKYDIKATFFFTGYYAELFPEAVKMILPYGHEVGSHGYSHKVDQAFDVLSLDEQIKHLEKSKKILEDISGQQVVSFRAPAARVNKDTAIALKETGFLIDSSVSSQRFDMFLSFGSLRKMNWITAPRLPYFTAPDNLWKKGNGSIFEIPISALLLPYIGTTLRIMPPVTRGFRNLLHTETSINKKPIVFLTHPNEFIDETLEAENIERRVKNFLSYLLGDVIRRNLKSKNLGKKALPIYERELRFFAKRNYQFMTMHQYYEICNPKK
jgi:peptidoglycan/xylan/chitin deacetylase (PgdA/CDA1 family)